MMLYLSKINNEHVSNTFTISCEKLKIIFFTSVRMKNIIVFPTFFRFSVKFVVLFVDQQKVLVVCSLKSKAIIKMII